MHKLPAVVVQVFLYNAMDKTLKDYIERAQKQIDEDRKKPITPNPNQYPVFPERKGEEDNPQNPYGQH